MQTIQEIVLRESKELKKELGKYLKERKRFINKQASKPLKIKTCPVHKVNYRGEICPICRIEDAKKGQAEEIKAKNLEIKRLSDKEKRERLEKEKTKRIERHQKEKDLKEKKEKNRESARRSYEKRRRRRLEHSL